jgi:ribosomal-protein-alanine N-acetyltransferase
MRFRDYRASDFKRLCEIDRRCFEARKAYSEKEMKALVERSGPVAIVAESTRRVIGFVLAETAGRGRGHIVTVDVLPKHRGRGVGRELMRRCEERLRDRGVRIVRLETAVSNRGAQALYRSLGYGFVGRAARYYADGEDAWIMEKALEPRDVRT